MGAQSITLVGNLTAAPELRFGKSGSAVCRLTVACQDRYRDAQGQYQDGETLFQRGVIFGAMAENFAASFNRGDRVVLTGTLRQSEYDHTNDDGTTVKRWSTDFVVDEAGASVRWAEVRVNRANRGGGRRMVAESQDSRENGGVTADQPWDTVPSLTEPPVLESVAG